MNRYEEMSRGALIREVTSLTAERDRLRVALKAITDHFAGVMAGPMVAGRGVKFANGIDGIPTIAAARIELGESDGSSGTDHGL